MDKQLEIKNYETTMARCSASAIKWLVWICNNSCGGTMLISDIELKESEELAIAYWKRKILLCPQIAESAKELYKEMFEQKVHDDSKKLKSNLQEVLPKQYCFRPPTL